MSVTILQTVDVTTWVATYVTGKSRDLTPQTEQNAQSLFELGLTFITTVRNQEAGHPGKLATDFLQLLVLHEMSKKLYHWKA